MGRPPRPAWLRSGLAAAAAACVCDAPGAARRVARFPASGMHGARSKAVARAAAPPAARVRGRRTDGRTHVDKEYWRHSLTGSRADPLSRT